MVGNWKMELSHLAAVNLATSLKRVWGEDTLRVQVVVCPSFPALLPVAEILKPLKELQLGAQNVHWQEQGAWTGEVAVSQIKPFVQWCLVGHSERRALVGETDEQVQAKAQLLIKEGLRPIVCLGETAAERAQELIVETVTQQVEAIFTVATRTTLQRLVIAYEPVWAIGSGEMPAPSEAAEVMLLIRKLAAQRFGEEVAAKLCIIYGGSVNARTVEPFVAEPGIDGVLVGGASVQAREFAEIVRVVERVSGQE